MKMKFEMKCLLCRSQADRAHFCLLVYDFVLLKFLIRNIYLHIFQHEFEELFLCFGSASFTYLSSFGRVIVNYDNVASAALAKIQLHFTDYKDKELKVYFKEV